MLQNWHKERAKLNLEAAHEVGKWKGYSAKLKRWILRQQMQLEDAPPPPITPGAPCQHIIYHMGSWGLGCALPDYTRNHGYTKG